MLIDVTDVIDGNYEDFIQGFYVATNEQCQDCYAGILYHNMAGDSAEISVLYNT